MRRDSSLIPLSHQHQHGLALCVLVRRGLERESISVLARRVVDEFDRELSTHFAIEEEVLFPLCGPMPIVAELLNDHRTIEALVMRLRTDASPAVLEEFCDLVSRHIRREENDLFEHIQRVLPREELGRAASEIRRRIDATSPEKDLLQ
jgi:iron-sulfur cluster repair protein YtfE (RIC family)